MKLEKKNMPTFAIILILATLCGSLAWEIIERILIEFFRLPHFSLTMKEPVRLFDFYVFSVSFRANLGTLIGIIGSFIFFGIL